MAGSHKKMFESEQKILHLRASHAASFRAAASRHHGPPMRARKIRLSVTELPREK